MRRSHNAIMNLTARINPATPNPSAVCRCLTRCGQDGRAPNLAKRRAGVHARRNNTALNTSTSPFSRIRHPCTPEKPQASSSHRQSLRPGWPRAELLRGKSTCAGQLKVRLSVRHVCKDDHLRCPGMHVGCMCSCEGQKHVREGHSIRSATARRAV